MSIINVRFGFATNSSSTHSLIVLNEGDRMRDLDIEEEGVDSEEFGWGNFTCASEYAKMAWLGQVLRLSLDNNLPADLSGVVIEKLIGQRPADGGYVDHQSVLSFPTEHPATFRPFLNREFLQDLVEFIKRPDVVILGGNDNSDGHPDEERGFNTGWFGLPRDEGKVRLVCRKEADKLWTLFNRDNGTRVTVDLLDPRKPREFAKLDRPLLVDLKITDYCGQGCRYCYQGSTPTGRHADFDHIDQILRTLSGMGVMEVAIGGGEPTDHPRFLDILRKVEYYGMVPNFSTRSLDWLSGPDGHEILGLIGGFAFSVDNLTSAELACAAAKQHDDDMGKKGVYYGWGKGASDKLSIQYVMGSTDLATFNRIVQLCKEQYTRLTLLGYKTTGRGNQFLPHSYSGWTDLLDNPHDLPRLGVDTELARSFQSELDKHQIDRITYQTREGKQSMYWDAVTARIGPSSFCAESEMIPVQYRPYHGMDQRLIEAAFRSF